MNTFQLLIGSFSVVLLFSCNTQNNNDPSKKLEQENTKINAVSNSDSVSDSDDIAKSVGKDESIKILFFGDDYSSYKLELKGENVKLIYTFQKYEPIIEKGKFKDFKIIIDGCDDCYELVNSACDGCQLRWELCVYNGETDGKDCYSFNGEKSNCIVKDLF